MISIDEVIAQLCAEIELRSTAIKALERLSEGDAMASYPEEQEKIIQPDSTIVTVGQAKQCSKCHHMKPLSAFPANKTCRDGHEGVCKACRRPGKKAARKESRTCKVCGKEKPMEAFPKAPFGSGRIATCAECRADAFRKTLAAKKASKAKAAEPSKPVSEALLPPRLDHKNRCEACHAVFGSPAMLAEHMDIRHGG